MEAYLPLHNGRGAVQFVQDKMPQFTLSTYLAILAFMFIATRAITGINSQRRNELDKDMPLRVRKAPYWIPLYGHLTPLERVDRDFISNQLSPINEAIVALQVQRTTLNMVLSPSMGKILLSHPAASVDPIYHRVMKRVFDDRGLTQRMDPKHRKALDAADLVLAREPSVSQLSQAAVKLIERETANLISFNRSLVDQAVWERDAKVTVVDGSDNPEGEAQLFSLTQTFIGWVTTSLILGQAFIEFYPTFWEDLWVFDSQSYRFAAGFPPWIPLPGVSAGYAARDRLLRAMTAFETALRATEEDHNPSPRFRDMEDVSEAMKRRSRILREIGYSSQDAARIDLEFVYRTHVGMSKILFWILLHLYHDPKVLSDIRNEIAPFVTAKRPRPEDTGFPFVEPPRVSCDLNNLLKSCPLLKAAYIETLRLHKGSCSFRITSEDMILTESTEDTTIFDSPKPRAYQLRKGDIVVVPHGVHQTDRRFFSEPETFNPRRFLITDPGTGSLKVDTTSLRAEMEGMFEFESHTIAESEILSATATIISVWDIEHVDTKGWKIPRAKSGSSGSIPIHDVRVRMKHRI